MVAEIAYIVKGFPRLSETFISNEVLLLERMGARLRVFSIKRPEESSASATLQSRLEYLPPVTSLSGTALLPWLWRNVPLFQGGHRRLLRRNPLRYLRTLGGALGMTLICRDSWLSRPKKVFVKEFLQAGYIADRIVDEGSICHLHAHFCHGATTITLFVSRLSGIPFSFTAHAKDIYQVGQNPGALLAVKIRASQFVVTCTGANQRYLNALGAGGPVHRVYHGLDVDRFRPLAGAVSTAVPEILAVGRYVEKKGFRTLVDACSRLRNRGRRFRCRIIGEQGEGFEPLVRWVEALGLQQHMVLEGPVPHEALVSVYQQAAIFALPCQIVDDGDRDGIPNVLVEAMACGLTVVSTPVSGIPELIEHEVNGLLVPQKDSTALAAALERLLHDRALRERLGAGARRTVCERFDSSRTTLELKRLFDASVGHECPADAATESLARVRIRE